MPLLLEVPDRLQRAHLMHVHPSLIERERERERERESSLLTTYGSDSTSWSRLSGGPASRHGGLNSVFQVASYLPSYYFPSLHYLRRLNESKCALVVLWCFIYIASFSHCTWKLISTERYKIICCPSEDTPVFAGQTYDIPPGHDMWVVGDSEAIVIEFDQPSL